MRAAVRFLFMCMVLAMALSFVPAAAEAALAENAGDYVEIPLGDVSASASSELKDRYGKYPAEYANDGNSRTTWAEQADGNGEGEWLEFSFPEQNVAGFTIRAGYHKSSSIYKKNARPREILVSVGDNDPVAVQLDDVRSPQTVLFDRPVAADSLTITLSTFYGGTKYEDTCITDVRILSAGEADETSSVVSEDDSWQGRYRSFIRRHFPVYQSSAGTWPFMELIDLDFDGIPELILCIDDSHLATYHIVSGTDGETWAELPSADDNQLRGYFQLLRPKPSGEPFWLCVDQVSYQGETGVSESLLDYAPGSFETETLFVKRGVMDPAREDYGSRTFLYKDQEVSEDEYDRRYQAFHDENKPMAFSVARTDEASSSVSEALSNFDALSEAYAQ